MRVESPPLSGHVVTAERPRSIPSAPSKRWSGDDSAFPIARLSVVVSDGDHLDLALAGAIHEGIRKAAENEPPHGTGARPIAPGIGSCGHESLRALDLSIQILTEQGALTLVPIDRSLKLGTGLGMVANLHRRRMDRNRSAIPR